MAANVPREVGTVPGGDCPITRPLGQSVHAAPDRDRRDPVVANVLVALYLDPGELVVMRALQEVDQLVLNRAAVVDSDVLALFLVDDLELERVVRHRRNTNLDVALTIALILGILF